MKKTILLTICILIFVTAESFGRGEPLANDGKSGLYARSIERALQLDEGEVDLATAVLIISEQWNDNVYGRRYLTKLDNMAFEIRDKLQAKGIKADFRAITVINEYLFEEKGFESVPEANDPDNLFLHSVLEKKRGYCLSLSVLYLSLAERLGLPLYGVVVPGHFFVRYDDGQVRFNIETTSKGGYADDEHYTDKFNVPQGGDDSIYMVSLNKIQTLGCFFNNLGNSYSDVGNAEQALVALERAVQINPSLAESRMNLGNIYLEKGQLEDAIYQYQSALRINPDDAKTHNNLGNAYTRRGWWNDAISQYTQSLRLDAKFTEAYKNMASAYCKREMFGQAIAALKQAIILEPKNAGCYSQLGDVYGQLGDCGEAVFQYEKALKIKSDFANAHYGLAVCYNKLGQVDDEIQAYQKALAVEPNMIAALMNLGNAYFGRKEYEAAIEQYSKAIRIKPGDGTAYYNLGAAYSNMSRYEQAVVEYERAVEIEPKMGDAHKGLALAFYRLKKYDLADKHIRIAEQSGAEIDEDLLDALEDKLR